MSFEQSIKKYSGKLPEAQFRIISPDDFEISTVNRGVLFVFAAWSGPAVVSYQLLCHELAQTQTATISVLVVDIDFIDQEFSSRVFGGALGGWGEALWIKDGQPAHLDKGYALENVAVLKARVREFG